MIKPDHISDESDIGEIIVDHDILNKLKARVQLARDIDKAQHQVTKRNHEENWMKERVGEKMVNIPSLSDLRTKKVKNRRISRWVKFPNVSGVVGMMKIGRKAKRVILVVSFLNLRMSEVIRMCNLLYSSLLSNDMIKYK